MYGHAIYYNIIPGKLFALDINVNNMLCRPTCMLDIPVAISPGLIRMQQLFDALAEEEHVLKVNVIRVSGVDDAVAKLSSIDRRRDDEDKRILLDMPARETEKLLSRQVNRLYTHLISWQTYRLENKYGILVVIVKINLFA